MMRKFSCRELAVFLLTGGAPLAWVYLRGQPFAWFTVWIAGAHLLALVLWAFHLRRSGLRLVWALPAVFGLGMLLTAGPSGSLDSTGLEEAVFLYILISLFSAYDREPRLQALAAAALLMSAGILTKPPVAISCVLVGLTFFLLHRRQTLAGTLGFALLMFTPMTLCVICAGMLTFLTGGLLGAAAIAPSLPDPPPPHAGTGMNWLILPVAVVFWRVFSGRSASSDIAFVFLLTAAPLLSLFPQMPQPLHRVDLFYLSVGGAAALLAQSPGNRRETVLSRPGNLGLVIRKSE